MLFFSKGPWNLIAHKLAFKVVFVSNKRKESGDNWWQRGEQSLQSTHTHTRWIPLTFQFKSPRFHRVFGWERTKVCCWNWIVVWATIVLELPLTNYSQIVGVISNTSVSSPLFWQIEHTEIWSLLPLFFSSNWKQSFWKRKKWTDCAMVNFFLLFLPQRKCPCLQKPVCWFVFQPPPPPQKKASSFVFIDEGVNNNDDDDDDDDDWWRSCRSAAFDDSASTVSPFPF